MDSHVPETSPSGFLHGMGLACLLGYGNERLTGIAATDTAGFGVSINFDALDPRDAPGVGYPTPEGLRAEVLLPALKRLGVPNRFFRP